ncbi:MAG TPA: plastocyanin/azurin family copper-binding protein [Gemmatimonadales bacterium]|nr:plastocyanin/azurin family copper-binding protein [Gemmatimonadales bacterium]
MTPTRRAVALLCGAISVGTGVLACFSERGSGPTVNTAAECRVPVSTIDSLHYLVAIRNFAFHPDSLNVPRGATVTWVNCEDAGTEPHTTTSDSAVWSSPDLAPGNTFSHTFAASGIFLYHCTPHPFMTGKVVVQ